MKARIFQLLPFLIIASITAFLFLAPSFSAPKETAKKARGPAVVTTVRVSGREFREAYQTLGVVAGQTEIKITSQIEGVLQEVSVKIGQTVKKGDTLATLDQRLLSAELAQAEAALTRSVAELQRARELLVKGILAGIRVEAGIAQQVIDRAAVDKLHTQLSLSRFPSLIDGVVTAQFAYPGDTVRSGSAIFAMAEVSRLRVLAKVPETVASRLKPGASAELKAEAAGSAELAATVTKVYPAADPVSHQTTIELDAGNVFPILKPGYLVNIDLTLAENRQALMLDRRTVLDARSDGTITLMRIRNGQAESRKVQIGRVLEEHFEILAGLDEGDEVVLRGGEKLKNGDPVRVFGGEPAAKSGRKK